MYIYKFPFNGVNGQQLQEESAAAEHGKLVLLAQVQSKLLVESEETAEAVLHHCVTVAPGRRHGLDRRIAIVAVFDAADCGIQLHLESFRSVVAVGFAIGANELVEQVVGFDELLQVPQHVDEVSFHELVFHLGGYSRVVHRARAHALGLSKKTSLEEGLNKNLGRLRRDHGVAAGA